MHTNVNTKKTVGYTLLRGVVHPRVCIHLSTHIEGRGNLIFYAVVLTFILEMCKIWEEVVWSEKTACGYVLDWAE